MTGTLFPAAENYFNLGTEGIYQGSRLVDPSDATVQAQEQMRELAPQFDAQYADFMQGFNPLLDNTVSSVEDIFAQGAANYGTRMDATDFLAAADVENARSQEQISNLVDQLGTQAGEQFASQILPQIGDAATAAGQYGSSRQGVAEGVAAADVQSGLNTQIAQLLQQDLTRQDALRESGMNRAFDLYGTDIMQKQFDITQQLGQRGDQLNRSLQASQLFPELMQGQLMGTDLMNILGTQLDATGQAQLEDEIQESEAVRNAELLRLQQYAGLLGYQGPQQFTTITEQDGGGSSPFQSLLGAGMVAGGLGWSPFG